MKYLILIVLFFPICLQGFSNQVILDEVNEVRAEHGLTTVQIDEHLNLLALLKACDLVVKGYWAHSDNGNPWTFFQRYGFNFRAGGEVLARNYINEQETVVGWMGSPTHREILTDPVYKQVGIATVASTTVMIFVDGLVSPPWVVPIKNNAL